MFSFKGKHGLQAILAAAGGIIALAAEHAAILPPKVGITATGLALIIAAWSKKPGTPKAP